ncbi:MAG: hypothetical protein LBI28_04010 [Treponema sp.]|jgi:hypothetical protein|nr:hypothetical protein [Treponema sp.]
MAETADITNYTTTLQEVLITRKDWLDRSELVRLKENLRAFQVSYASLYNIFLKKKLIDEDPYKQETKISELEVPESGAFQEAKRIEQLSVRLSNFDNQLDFLVNFYQLGMDFLNLDRIKRIVGLVRYIDWTGLSPDSQSLMTKAVSEMANTSKVGVDTLTLSIIGESLSKLSKTTVIVMTILKDLNKYFREEYKAGMRQSITQSMSASEATPENIKKKMPSAMPGSPFYRELIEEIIKEDYSENGTDLRDGVLNSLRVVETKQKAAKAAVNYKAILLDGIQVIGGASNSLAEISAKLADNQAVMDSRKKSFFETIKELIRQITNAEPPEVIYNVEFVDATKGVPVKEKVYFHSFMSDLDKKTKILTSFVRGPAYTKLSNMTEEQIIGYLERNISDVQKIHKTLGALDDFFKANVVPADRGKIKGIKPELSALKNTFVKANQLRYDYSAQKEEEEQMKRLGVNVSAPTSSETDHAAPPATPPAPAPAP